PSPLPIFAEFAAELPPPQTLALSFHCIPAFLQSARVKGCGAAKAGPKPTTNTINDARILMYLSLISFLSRSTCPILVYRQEASVGPLHWGPGRAFSFVQRA